MRYVLIENRSGYIFGDTAAFDSDVSGPAAAARSLDEDLGHCAFPYVEVDYAPGVPGYRVYRIGATAPAIVDGRDADFIDLVERWGHYEGFFVPDYEARSTRSRVLRSAG